MRKRSQIRCDADEETREQLEALAADAERLTGRRMSLAEAANAALRRWALERKAAAAAPIGSVAA